MSDYNLSLSQGIPFTLLMNVKDESGVLTNLSGFTVSGLIKNRFSDVSGIAPIDCSIIEPESGIILMSMTAVATAALPVTQYIYGVEAYNNDIVLRLLQGYLSICPEVIH